MSLPKSLINDPAAITDEEAARMTAAAKKIIARTQALIGTTYPPDVICTLIFTIGELAETSGDPGRALEVIADQFVHLAELARSHAGTKPGERCTCAKCRARKEN